MKLFVLVIFIATILGGFVGGELMDKTFSILGATVGGVGLTATLLSLGAYFTAQDDKKKQKISPEIRGVFDRMLSGNVASNSSQAWKPRPFSANNTREDFLVWFANVKPWDKVDTQIIEMLIDKFGSNPLFEVFVHISQDFSLINRYVQLNKIASSRAVDFVIYSRIAIILSAAAEDSRAEIAKAIKSKNVDIVKAHYSKATDALETAILIEPNLVLLYLQMATLKAMIGKKGDVIKYCQEGLRKTEELKKMPFDKSGIDSLKGAQGQIAQIEESLKLVLAQASS